MALHGLTMGAPSSSPPVPSAWSSPPPVQPHARSGPVLVRHLNLVERLSISWVVVRERVRAEAVCCCSGAAGYWAVPLQPMGLLICFATRELSIFVIYIYIVFFAGHFGCTSVHP